MTPLRQKMMACAIILLAVFAAYSSSFQGVFVYDDFINIVNNPAIHHMPDAVVNTSRPLTNLSFYLQYRCGLTHAADFHAVSMLLHAVNSLLVWGLLWELARHVAASRRIWFSTGAALLWAVHPVHTESVTYIVQRAEVLSVTFMLAGLLLGIMNIRERKNIFAVGAAVFFILAYMSKPTAVSAPFLLLLIDTAAISRGIRKALRDNWLLHSLSVLSLAVPLYILSGMHESRTSSGFSMQAVGFGQYIAFQPRAVALYLSKLVWPRNLIIDYGLDVEHGWLPAACFAAAIAAGVTAILKLTRKGGVSRLGLGWFFIVLAPVLLVPLADLFAEHRVYLASAGISVLMSAALLEFCRRIAGSADGRVRAFVLITGLLVLLLGARTWTRNLAYRDPLILWQQVVDTNPDNVRGYLGVGSELAGRGDLRSAESALRMGIKVYRGLSSEFLRESCRTDYAYTCRNLGAVLLAQGQADQAEAWFTEASDNAAEFR